MPRVVFAKDFDCPFPGGFVAYKAGFSGLIPHAHVERARAADVLERKGRKPADTPAPARTDE